MKLSNLQSIGATTSASGVRSYSDLLSKPLKRAYSRSQRKQPTTGSTSNRSSAGQPTQRFKSTLSWLAARSPHSLSLAL